MAAPLPSARAAVQAMGRRPALRLWITEAGSQVPLLDDAEALGVLDRLRFLLRRAPDRGFERRFVTRWGRRPTPAAASTFDAVVRGTGGAETAAFLVHEDIADAARAWPAPSAWGAPTRAGSPPFDFTRAAGYDVATARREAPSAGGAWRFVPTSTGAPP